MKKEIIKINKLFKTKEALEVLPETITVWHDLKPKSAEIDIIVTGFGKAELSNATALNYILLEDKLPVNIIIVESSGKKEVYKQLINHKKVSKILVEDLKVSHPVYGAGSYGMAITAAVGFYFTKSPYVFFSHNDMIALKKDFLQNLLSKLNENVRIASFTQRHIIPFTGCMLIDRKVIENSQTDWLLYDKNPYIKQSTFLQKICKIRENGTSGLKCDWIDAGEAFLYEELSKNKQLYVAASFGGTKGMWITPFELLQINKKDITNIENLIIYGNRNISKKEFQKKYKFVLKAGRKWESLRWFLSRKKNYWRYSLDEQGDLVFIHHGRGTRRSLNRWIEFTRKVNSRLS
ncbi:MAG: hypothetical protein L3J74_03730 [Bacteroidales bacterium]|nr:hypothetical protein [Bacteroidales bacterium]